MSTCRPGLVLGGVLRAGPVTGGRGSPQVGGDRRKDVMTGGTVCRQGGPGHSLPITVVLEWPWQSRKQMVNMSTAVEMYLVKGVYISLGR